jgi:hypothetical protein
MDGSNGDSGVGSELVSSPSLDDQLLDLPVGQTPAALQQLLNMPLKVPVPIEGLILRVIYSIHSVYIVF